MRTLPADLAAAMLPGFDQVAETDDLGLDEPLLEVGVNHSGRLGGDAPTGMVQARDSLGPAVR